jgi:YfiH family protein
VGSIAVPHGAPPLYLTFPALAALGLPHAATTRHFPGLADRGGGGPFAPEAARALAPAGLDLGRAAWARQVHGAVVAAIAAPGLARDADALLTTAPGLPLAIFTADCLALILHDPAARTLAVVHAGWRGTVRGIAQAAVAASCAAGARPERLAVAIGPSIGPCCYEVDEPVTAELARAYPGAWHDWVTPARPGHVMLDLWRANADLLARAGVPAGAIANPRLCTACDPAAFYSYRKGHHGRLMTVAALPPDGVRPRGPARGAC